MRYAITIALALAVLGPEGASASSAGRVEGRVLIRPGAPAIPTVLLYRGAKGSDYRWTNVREGRFSFERVRPGIHRLYSGLVTFWSPGFCDPYVITYQIDDRTNGSPLIRVRAGEVTEVTMVVTRPPCADLAITKLAADGVPVAQGVPLNHAWQRSITVAITNIGDRSSGPIDLLLQAENQGAVVPPGSGDNVVARVTLPPLRAGARESRTFLWEPTGTVGDVRLRATVATKQDRVHSNNERTRTVRFVVTV